MNYVDKNGKECNVGDILYYNEGDGYAKSICKIIEKEGELFSETLFYDHYMYGWTECDFEDLVELKYFTSSWNESNRFTDAEIISIKEDDIDIDWLNKTYPIK